MLEVCETQGRVHRAQRRGMMQKLSGEALWVLACAAEGGSRRERWTVGVPACEDGGGESADERGYGEPDEGAG